MFKNFAFIVITVLITLLFVNIGHINALLPCENEEDIKNEKCKKAKRYPKGTTDYENAMKECINAMKIYLDCLEATYDRDCLDNPSLECQKMADNILMLAIQYAEAILSGNPTIEELERLLAYLKGLYNKYCKGEAAKSAYCKRLAELIAEIERILGLSSGVVAPVPDRQFSVPSQPPKSPKPTPSSTPGPGGVEINKMPQSEGKGGGDIGDGIKGSRPKTGGVRPAPSP